MNFKLMLVLLYPTFLSIICIGQETYLPFDSLEKRNHNSKFIAFKIGHPIPFTGIAVKYWDSLLVPQIKNFYINGFLNTSEYYRLDKTLEEKLVYNLNKSDSVFCYIYDKTGALEAKGFLIDQRKAGGMEILFKRQINKKKKRGMTKFSEALSYL